VVTKLPSYRVRIPTVGVHLQLPVDVGLVYQRVQNIQDRVNIPNLGIPAKGVQFFRGTLAKFSPELAE